MSRAQFLLVGVGGQGVLTSAQILGAAAHAQGLRIVVGQLHGMSQRGGSVQCTVVLGEDALGSMFCVREADVVVAFEPIEAVRALPQMGPRTRVVTSRAAVVPFEIVRRREPLPDVDDLLDRLRGAVASVHALDTRRIACALGGTRAHNVLMLGAAAGLGLLPVGDEALLEAVRGRCGERFFGANKAAFEAGKGASTAADSVHARQSS